MSNLDLVERYDSYEDYLDSQLTINDMGTAVSIELVVSKLMVSSISVSADYLEDEEMARQLVELGYRGTGDTIRREVSDKSWQVVLTLR